jgi:hypothetical protein
METATNGKPAGHDAHPAIKVLYNAETQAVGLEFDPKDFRSWEFIKAVLGMALAKADDAQRATAAAMMMQAQQDQQIRKSLLRGR